MEMLMLFRVCACL